MLWGTAPVPVSSGGTGTNPDGKVHQVNLYTALVPIP